MPRVLAAVSVLLATAFAAPAAQARDGVLNSFDGTKIVYSFFPASGLQKGAKAPTVLVGHGYGQSREKDPEAKSETLFGSVGVGALRHAGFNVLTWDSRGFGQSGGQVTVDAPDTDVRDVEGLIDVVAREPEAQLDAPGDPRMGMSGVSYAGGIQLNTAASDQRIDAITPTIAWHSLLTSLEKDRTVKAGWGAALYGAGEPTSATQGLIPGGPASFQTGDQDPRITQALTEGLATGRFSDASEAFFASRGPGDRVAQIKVPTLLVEGTADTLFTLHEAIENFRILQGGGAPVSMLWFCGGHGVCLTNPGDGTIIEKSVVAWLRRYVMRDASVDTGPAFRWIADDGVLRDSASYPPPPAEPLKASGSGLLPIAPASTSGTLIAATPAANAVNVDVPAVAGPTQVVGEPALGLTYKGRTADPDARVFAQIVDTGRGVVLGNQATPLPLKLDGEEHKLSRPLEAVAASLTPASRLRLQITDATNDYGPQRTAGEVSFSSVDLTLPTAQAAAAATPAPAPASCTIGSRTFTLHATRKERIVSARAYLGGKLVRTRKGKRVKTIKLDLPTGRYSVRIDTTSDKGVRRRSRRAVDGCAMGRPKTVVLKKRATR